MKRSALSTFAAMAAVVCSLCEMVRSTESLARRTLHRGASFAGRCHSRPVTSGYCRHNRLVRQRSRIAYRLFLSLHHYLNLPAPPNHKLQCLRSSESSKRAPCVLAPWPSVRRNPSRPRDALTVPALSNRRHIEPGSSVPHFIYSSPGAPNVEHTGRHDDPEEKRADMIRAEIMAGHRFHSFANQRGQNFVKWCVCSFPLRTRRAQRSSPPPPLAGTLMGTTTCGPFRRCWTGRRRLSSSWCVRLHNTVSTGLGVRAPAQMSA